jgi:tryptophan-rich sensory protein
MNKAPSRLLIFVCVYALCFVVQTGGAYFTQLSVTTWYAGLDKSPLTPPGMVFGIVWTTLYLLMALAAMRVYHKTQTLRSHALRWWLIQLVLGFLWSVMFFGNQAVLSAFQIILANLVAIGVMLVFLRRIDRVAALMLAPLFLWVSFASYLNYFILMNN